MSAMLCCQGLSVRGEEKSVNPPLPFGVIPSERQLKYQEMEFYGFIHFGMDTFTDKEWGYGDDSPELFNPTDFDAEKVVQTLKDSGMKGIVLVCKHHDGFCLWPSKFTDYSVKKSPWRNGKGDFVKEMADACHRLGMKFGVYLSPWDRHSKDFGKPEYITYYRDQLSELLSNYGDVFMTWHDGAQGKGDGFYGGARDVKIIDRRTYYDWPETWELVRKLQPGAVIRSDSGPDVRWIGNTFGAAADSCWCTVDLRNGYPGMSNREGNAAGIRSGSQWMPPECDISIRKGWFYHEKDNFTVKSPKALVDLYYRSVGRGADLNLNVPLDKRGMIFEKDADSLAGMHQWLTETFATNLAVGAKVTASNSRGGDKRFGAENLIDENRESYWSTDDGITNSEVTFELKKPETFNVVRLREYLPLGQRVEAFALDQWRTNQWQEFAQSTSIGSQRLIRLSSPITTDRVRLRIVKSPVCPALSEFGLYREPVQQLRTSSN